jgi:hypothetical protein
MYERVWKNKKDLYSSQISDKCVMHYMRLTKRKVSVYIFICVYICIYTLYNIIIYIYFRKNYVTYIHLYINIPTYIYRVKKETESWEGERGKHKAAVERKEKKEKVNLYLYICIFLIFLMSLSSPPGRPFYLLGIRLVIRTHIDVWFFYRYCIHGNFGVYNRVLSVLNYRAHVNLTFFLNWWLYWKLFIWKWYWCALSFRRLLWYAI